MLLTYYLLSIMTARDLEQSFNLVVTACMVAQAVACTVVQAAV